MLAINVVFLVAILYALNRKIHRQSTFVYHPNYPIVTRRSEPSGTGTHRRLALFSLSKRYTSCPSRLTPSPVGKTKTSLLPNAAEGDNLYPPDVPNHHPMDRIPEVSRSSHERLDADHIIQPDRNSTQKDKQNSAGSSIGTAGLQNGHINKGEAKLIANLNGYQKQKLISPVPSPEGTVVSEVGCRVNSISSVDESERNWTTVPRPKPRPSTRIRRFSVSLMSMRSSRFNSTGSAPSRYDSTSGSRIRLWKLVGRISIRELVKTVKSGLTLMPLLGLPEIIFIQDYHPSLKPAFQIIHAVFVSTRGFWVALLYCFLNDEVKKQFRMRFHSWAARYQLHSNQRVPLTQKPHHFR